MFHKLIVDCPRCKVQAQITDVGVNDRGQLQIDARCVCGATVRKVGDINDIVLQIVSPESCRP